LSTHSENQTPVALNIRAPHQRDEPGWRNLWAAYNRFYRAEVPDDVTAALWQKLVSRAADITGLLAEQNGTIIGLAHMLFHPSTWSHAPTCYLEDLFVAKSARGTGAARALIDATIETARNHRADRLYWHTQEFNGAARSLYDTVAERTSFIVYRKSI
jgi:GNAT superfamily N-acetyltransferase